MRDLVLLMLAHVYHRPLLARTMDSLEQGWGNHPRYGYVVLGNLVQDLNVMVEDKSRVDSDKRKGFSRLCNCMDAVLVKHGRVSEDDLLGESKLLHIIWGHG